MNIKSRNDEMDKSHLSRLKNPHKHKSDKKNVVNDHLHKVTSSISHIQDKSYEAIGNKIHGKYGSRSVSNIYATP